MTQQGGGFSIAPQRLGGAPGSGRARRRRLAVAGVLVVGVAIIGIGWLGPRLSARPYLDTSFFATPTPRSTPTPRPTATFARPTATPLPVITRPGGESLTGQLGVFGQSFVVIDLATGEQSREVAAAAGQDLIVPDPDRTGWLCLCMRDRSGTTGIAREVSLIRIDPSGIPEGWRTLTLLGDVASPDVTTGIQTDIDLAPDGRTGLLAATLQRRSGWTYIVVPIDFVGGSVGQVMTLGTQRNPYPASPPPPDATPGFEEPPPEQQAYVNGPLLRIDPLGANAYVRGTLQAYDGEQILVNETVAWRIPLDPAGRPSTSDPEPAPGFAALKDFCWYGAFTAVDQFDSICADYSNPTGSEGQPAWSVVHVTGDGRDVQRSAVHDLAIQGGDVIFDRANRAAWMWDGGQLRLARIDLRSGTVVSETFDPGADITAGVGPIGGATPDWLRSGSALYRSFGGQMLGSRDGSRLYLLAYDPTSSGDRGPRSLGVFIVDPATLALVGRWAPDASYVSLQSALDGSMVVAAGQAGVDSTGKEAPWQASLTFHAASDGHIVARYARFGEAWGPVIIGR